MFETWLDQAACDRKLEAVRKLIARIRDGSLDRLTETRVEQSFNERLFAEVFDYRTLLRDGAGDYHLLPKGGVAVGRSTKYDDFSLGFFGSAADVRRVHAELKGYGSDLDKVQTGGGNRGTTPVEQAFGVATHVPGVEWIIVSNFDELRLYHLSDPLRYSRVVLSDILGGDDMRRAYAVFGRPSLLGEFGSASRTARMLQGGHPMILASEPHLVRFIQEARPLGGGEAASLPAMDDAFRAALARTVSWQWPGRSPQDPRLDDGRLVIEEGGQVEMNTRLEFARNGVVRLQEKLGTENPSGASPPVLVSSTALADRMARFVVLSALMIGPVFAGSIAYRWSILDGERLVILPGVLNRIPGLHSDVKEATSKEFIISAVEPSESNRRHIAGFLAPAIRDLFFSWSHVPSRGKITRLNLDSGYFEKMLEGAGC